MPSFRGILPILALLAWAGAAAPGQAQHGHGGHGATPATPYAGLQDRPVKALSAEEAADLRAGRGMAQALPAELNAYPGPMHVLELADPLGLTPAQREALGATMAQMRAAAVPLGERVIAAEAALEALFAEARATPEAVRAASRAVGGARAELRTVHLEAHVAARALLTPEQIRRYAALRGYTAAASPPR
jgi:Spy/CpxP family protein refolding chaperone